MSAEWEWRESDNVTVNSTVSFAPVNGTPTAETARFLNNTSTTDDSGDFLVTGVSRPAGVGDYLSTDALAALGYIEVRLTGSGGTGIVNQTTGWTKIGRGRYLRVKAIPAECWREFEVRLNIPLGAGVLEKDLKCLVIEDLRSIMLEWGHTEGGAQGLRMGLGDASFNEVLYGGLMTEDGTPDNTVHVSTVGMVFLGVPSVNLDELLTLSNADSAAATLSSGEEYLARVSVDGTGSATVTKSVKGTAPLSESLVPAVPDGHKSLGWVQVQFDATINTADIHQDDLIYGCAALVGTGTIPDIHPFEALIGDALIISPTVVPVSLTDDDVNYVWISPSGGVEANVTGLQPEDMSCLIYEVTVASGVITEVIDCRPWIYPNPVEVHLYRQGTLAGAQVFYGVLPTASQAYLLPIGGIVAAVGDRGGASGSTLFDVFATDRDNTYVTLFTDSGTQEERPEIAYNATNPIDTGSIPQVLSFHGGARFKGSVVSVPGTASVDAMLTLRFSAVGAA